MRSVSRMQNFRRFMAVLLFSTLFRRTRLASLDPTLRLAPRRDARFAIQGDSRAYERLTKRLVAHLYDTYAGTRTLRRRLGTRERDAT